MPSRASVIRFTAPLRRPVSSGSETPSWLAIAIPKSQSAKLPSRGMVSVEGTLNGVPFQATLQPDGDGAHWLKVDQPLQKKCGLREDEVVTIELAPVDQEPEPEVPPDLASALESAPKAARDAWNDITPVARRDWIQWVTSGKRAETRTIRIEKTCDMLASGKRRPCCFDRSGMYSKSLKSPLDSKSTPRPSSSRPPRNA